MDKLLKIFLICAIFFEVGYSDDNWIEEFISNWISNDFDNKNFKNFYYNNTDDYVSEGIFFPKSSNYVNDMSPSTSSKSESYIDASTSRKSYYQESSNLHCAEPPTICIQSKYRTLDGSCNNLENPALGMANTRYSRLLPPKYGDGYRSPKTSVTGEDLPNAREISLAVFGFKDIPDPDFTLFNMQWGQIMTHDMSMQAGGTQSKKPAVDCCTQNGELIEKHKADPFCCAIVVPRNDPILSKGNIQCMEFIRTLTDIEVSCPAKMNKHKNQAEQLTTVTHFMDLSLVYGNSDEESDSLRTKKGGRLRADIRKGREWLPQTPNVTTDCDVKSPRELCYLAGDSRVNQNPGLTILQTILLREHNRLADNLAKLNPQWNDEKLFQEARKINIAEYQHISYYEWLPIFLGYENMLKNRLIYKTNGDFVNDYDPSIDPSIINSHSTAAFRFFHSQIEGRLDLLTEHRNFQGSLRLSDWINRPGIIEAGDNFDSLTRGHSTQPEELTDSNVDTEMRHFLFKRHMMYGSDLQAIDIQRNRDHALASYNDFREFCGLPRANSWEDFLDYISPKDVQNLKSVYVSHEDVDLTVGGSLEALVPGTLAGPTFLCILTEQFYRTRAGDRFFYETGDKVTGFTKEQLNEIRKTSVARLLCDNSNNVRSMQTKAFATVSQNNPIVLCDEIPQINLTKWQI